MYICIVNMCMFAHLYVYMCEHVYTCMCLCLNELHVYHVHAGALRDQRTVCMPSNWFIDSGELPSICAGTLTCVLWKRSKHFFSWFS